MVVAPDCVIEFVLAVRLTLPLVDITSPANPALGARSITPVPPSDVQVIERGSLFIAATTSCMVWCGELAFTTRNIAVCMVSVTKVRSVTL